MSETNHTRSHELIAPMTDSDAARFAEIRARADLVNSDEESEAANEAVYLLLADVPFLLDAVAAREARIAELERTVETWKSFSVTRPAQMPNASDRERMMLGEIESLRRKVAELEADYQHEAAARDRACVRIADLERACDDACKIATEAQQRVAELEREKHELASMIGQNRRISDIAGRPSTARVTLPEPNAMEIAEIAHGMSAPTDTVIAGAVWIMAYRLWAQAALDKEEGNA